MKRFTIRIPNNMNAELESMATAHGKSKNTMIIDACLMFIESWMKKYGKEVRTNDRNRTTLPRTRKKSRTE